MNLMAKTQGSVPQKTCMSSGGNGEIKAEQESHPIDQREHRQVDHGHQPDAGLEIVPSPPPSRPDEAFPIAGAPRRIRRQDRPPAAPHRRRAAGVADDRSLRFADFILEWVSPLTKVNNLSSQALSPARAGH